MPSQSVLITGCSKGGIGDGLAREFHSRGLTVYATARDPAKMAHLKDLGIKTIALDVTSLESIAEAVKLVRELAGDRGLDMLINNAGLTTILPFADFPLDEMKRIMDTNVIGVFAVTQAFLPLLIRSKGTVVNVGSINEVVAPAFQVPYNASKAALNAFSRTLRLELHSFGVKVVHIATGAVQSNITLGAGDKMPADSLYSPVREMVEGRTMMQTETFFTPEEYARRVARDLLGNPPPVLWRGRMATLARLLNILLLLCPSRLAVSALTRLYTACAFKLFQTMS